MEKMMVFQKTPKRQKTELSVDAKDWMSKLPESIKHRILFFLPPKDAARTTILSKIWQQAWKSLLSIDFDFQNIHGSFFKSQDSEPEDVKLEKFMNFVDKTLQILHEEMVIIQKFILPMSLTDAKHASCIDNGLELATRNYIKELELTIIGKKITDYTLSRRIFVVESLAILRLWGCKLVEPLFGENTKFICLQELSLLAIDLDGKMIQELVCRCPMLEALQISCCSRVDYLQFLNLPKLKKAEFDSCLTIKINEAPNLQILSGTGIVRSFTFGYVYFRKCKEAENWLCGHF